MSEIEVSIINASDVVSDAECRALTDALQVQVSRDFAPAWRIDANLTFVPKGQKPAPGTWWLSILDNTDRAGVLGHHDLAQSALSVRPQNSKPFLNRPLETCRLNLCVSRSRVKNRAVGLPNETGGTVGRFTREGLPDRGLAARKSIEILGFIWLLTRPAAQFYLDSQQRQD